MKIKVLLKNMKEFYGTSAVKKTVLFVNIKVDMK